MAHVRQGETGAVDEAETHAFDTALQLAGDGREEEVEVT